jgi:hypothetical protein
VDPTQDEEVCSICQRFLGEFMEQFFLNGKAPTQDEDVCSICQHEDGLDDAPSHEPDHSLDEEPDDAPLDESDATLDNSPSFLKCNILNLMNYYTSLLVFY